MRRLEAACVLAPSVLVSPRLMLAAPLQPGMPPPPSRRGQPGPPGANARKFTVSLAKGFSAPVSPPRVVVEMGRAGLHPARPAPVARNTSH